MEQSLHPTDPPVFSSHPAPPGSGRTSARRRASVSCERSSSIRGRRSPQAQLPHVEDGQAPQGLPRLLDEPRDQGLVVEGLRPVERRGGLASHRPGVAVDQGEDRGLQGRPQDVLQELPAAGPDPPVGASQPPVDPPEVLSAVTAGPADGRDAPRRCPALSFSSATSIWCPGVRRRGIRLPAPPRAPRPSGRGGTADSTGRPAAVASRPHVEGHPGVPGGDPAQGAEDAEAHHPVLLGQEVALQHRHRVRRREARDRPGNVAPQLLGQGDVLERRSRNSSPARPERHGRRAAPRAAPPRGAAARGAWAGTTPRAGRAIEPGHRHLDLVLGLGGQGLEHRYERRNRLLLNRSGQRPTRLRGALAQDDLEERHEPLPRWASRREARPGRSPARGGWGRRGPSATGSSSGSTAVRARRAAARTSASGVIQETVGHRQEVRAPRRLEQLEGPEHDRRRRVIEDQGRHQVGPILRVQKIEGGDHLGVVPAVEGGEQRLERDEVQLRQPAPGLDDALAQGPAEHLHVVGPQLGDRGDPGHAEHDDEDRQDRVAAAQGQLGQDEDRGHRLPAPLPDHVDRRLHPRAQAVGDGQEEQLGAGAVERGTQGAVGPLHEHGGHEAAPHHDPARPPEHQERQRPQRPVHVEHPEDPAHQHDLHEQGEDAQRRRRRSRRSAPRSSGATWRATSLLKTKSASVTATEDDEHQPRQPRDVGLALEEAPGRRPRRQRARGRRVDLVARTWRPRTKRQPRGHRHDAAAERDQGLGQGTRRPRPGRGRRPGPPRRGCRCRSSGRGAWPG